MRRDRRPGVSGTSTPPLPSRALAELLGSAFLAALVIGSGIAAQELSPGNVGLQLFENAAAAAAGLFTIILMFGPVSGGHFNPVVSVVDASYGGISWRDALTYVPAQVAGWAAAVLALRVLYPDVTPADAAEVVLPRGGPVDVAIGMLPESTSRE